LNGNLSSKSVDFLPVFKEKEYRKRENLQVQTEAPVFRGLHFCDLHLVSVSLRKGLNLWQQSQTGTTLGSPEIDENRLRRMENLLLEAAAVYFNYRMTPFPFYDALWLIAV
jgi:hypothetical protein